MASDETVAPDSTPERLLLRRHTDGDSEAFPELMALYRSQVFSYIVRCGVHPSHRDDVFQEIFLAVHRNASSYNSSRALEPWLFTITANSVRTYFRRQKVRSIVEHDTERADSPTTFSAADESLAQETARWVEREIAKLPLAQREVLTLCCMRDISQSDVAEILQMPVNTVKTHLSRGRAALAKALARRNLTIHREAAV